jgi:hypothetical protein
MLELRGAIALFKIALEAVTTPAGTIFVTPTNALAEEAVPEALETISQGMSPLPSSFETNA